MTNSSETGLALLADDPSFVFSVYALILTPLALYVYHDVLDTRWRPVWQLFRFLVAYLVLYTISGAGLILYIVVQACAGDSKEVGASVLALILGTYGAWKLVRLGRIIFAHRMLVKLLQRIDISLGAITGLTPVGLTYHLFWRPHRSTLQTQFKSDTSYFEARHHYISSSLFDDDYPGEAAARIRWLAFFGRNVRVKQEDADECASRVALWMRLVLCRPRSEPWRLLTSTSPLVQGHMYRATIGEALRSLITHGSHLEIPADVDTNPAEILLNNGSLADAAIGIFWVASEMGSEEVAQVLAEMPPRWMRGVSQNGKQLMFELVMSLLLCEIPPIKPDSLSWILSFPVLDWTANISDIRIWTEMARICADAVATVTPKVTNDETPGGEWSTIRDAVLRLKDAQSDEFNFHGDVVGLSILELIRTAYRAGYIAEKLLGKELKQELAAMDGAGSELRLFHGEVVTGLYAIFYHLGQHNSDEYRKMFTVFRRTVYNTDVDDAFFALQMRAKREMDETYGLDYFAASRYWYLGRRNSRCENPPVAFASVVQTSAELAPLVVCMAQKYIRDAPRIQQTNRHGDPITYRRQWTQWKQLHTQNVAGSLQNLDSRLGGLMDTEHDSYS